MLYIAVTSGMADILAFSFGQMRIVAERSCKQRLCEKKGRSHIDPNGHFLVTFLVKILGVFGREKQMQYAQ